jgi:hypothetical protein
MLRSGLTLVLAVLALTLSGSAHAAVTVFQNPLNNPTPAAPVTIVAGGPNVTMNVFYQTGTNSSPGCPGVPPTCNRCLSGTGDEVCGWDIHISTTNPSITLVNFIPEAGADVVWAISGNVLRANGGVPTIGELGVHRIGSLVVSAAPAATGSVSVTGNRYASSALVAELVTAGNTLGTVGTAPDTDLDGIPDASDNCPTVANPGQQDGGGGLEVPADGVGDACDNCVTVSNPRVADTFLATNPWATLTGGQRDDDHDGYGNKCDGKFVGLPSQNVGGLDLGQFRTSNGEDRRFDTCGTAGGTRPCAIFDLDEAAVGNFIGGLDLGRFRQLSGSPPGPRCTACTGTGSVPLPCTAGTAGSCSP